MLQSHYSMEKLRDTLRLFYKRFRYSNADTDDLIQAMCERIESDPNEIKNFIKTWTLRPGYPLITIDESGKIIQQRFTNKGVIDEDPWPIPLFILSKSHDGKINRSKIMFNTKEADISEIVKQSEWVKLNPGYLSFCRVYYKGSMLEKLVNPIETKELDTIDRWSILNDSLSLSRACIMNYGQVLKLLSAYKNETDVLSVEPIQSFFLSCIKLFPSLKAELQKLGSKILGDILNNINAEINKSEKPNEQLLISRRSLLNTLAFRCMDQKIIEMGQNLFDEYIQTKKCDDNNMISFIFRCGAMKGRKEVEMLWKISQTEITPDIQAQSCIAVGFCPPDMIEENLLRSLEAKQQDVIYFFSGVSMNPLDPKGLWKFLKTNYQKIYDMFGSLAFNLPETFECAVHSFVTEEEADELENFFKEHPAKVAQVTVAKLVDSIRTTAKIANLQLDTLTQALNELNQ